MTSWNRRVERFIADGFVRIEGAFSRELAAACREILWADLGCSRDDPRTWTKPVVWLGMYAEQPFVEAANTPALHEAFDRLVGAGRWLAPASVGTFPVRFPARDDSGDTGWHIDASFPGKHSDPNDFLTWHVNLRSRGRALTMLFLFSDVGEHDAPTRLRAGSHLAIARALAPAGEEGLSISELDWNVTSSAAEALATGEAGTVYLCHPFLVHAAQVNRGSEPRFLAQPPLLPRQPFALDDLRDDEHVPVEHAIRRALRS